MRKNAVIFAVLTFLCCSGAGIYEQTAAFDRENPLTRILLASWQKRGIAPKTMASDVVFIRRVALTATGRLPDNGEVRKFLRDRSPDKRARLVEKYLASPEYADMQAMRFADMLRIKSEFPINLWPNAVQLWHRQIRDEIASDRPLDQMFTEMLTASGSNFRVPHANFFRASADRSPRGLASMVMLTTLGMRLDKLPEDQAAQFAALFGQVRYKSTYEWKEQIVYNDYIPATVRARLPDGTVVCVDSVKNDPRAVYAKWLTSNGKYLFARAMTNRVWHWVFGRGVYPVADDLPATESGEGENRPFAPEVQDFLSEEFIRSGCSLRHLYRVIMNSAAFQVSSVHGSEKLRAVFAAYPVRRLEAEVLVDVLAQITGQSDRYMSVIPEPFTFLPPGTRAVTVADGSISSGVLDNFGRPPRDSGMLGERNTQSSESQGLYLMNSAALDRRINVYCRRLNRRASRTAWRLDLLYLEILSRYPSKRERQIFQNYMQQLEARQKWRAFNDTVWVLLNSKEFLFYH